MKRRSRKTLVYRAEGGGDLFATGGASEGDVQGDRQAEIPGARGGAERVAQEERGVDALLTGAVGSMGPVTQGEPTVDRGALLGQGMVLYERYEVLRLLGRGGLGEVYLVEERGSGKWFALKRLSSMHRRLPSMRSRLRRELEVNARLRHPGIVKIEALCEDAEELYLLMQYVPGDNLQECLVSRQKAPDFLESAVQWAGETIYCLLQILHFVHDQGIIHCDLKPANVMSQPDGRMTVLDWGLARSYWEATQRDRSQRGTAYYMAPEQLKGHAGSPAVDIYAVGVIAYQLLTGELLTGRMPPARHLNPHVPAEVERVIDRAVAYDPSARYQDALQFAQAWADALSLGESAAKAPFAPPTQDIDTTNSLLLENSPSVGAADVYGRSFDAQGRQRLHLSLRRGALAVGESIQVSRGGSPGPTARIWALCEQDGAPLSRADAPAELLCQLTREIPWSPPMQIVRTPASDRAWGEISSFSRVGDTGQVCVTLRPLWGQLRRGDRLQVLRNDNVVGRLRLHDVCEDEACVCSSNMPPEKGTMCFVCEGFSLLRQGDLFLVLEKSLFP